MKSGKAALEMKEVPETHADKASKAEPVMVQSRPEDGFMPTAGALAPHISDARLLVLCSPMNPTGTMIADE